MQTLYDCKPAFQSWLQPWVKRLAQAQVSANQVTFAALLLSGAMGLAIALFPDQHCLWLGFPLVLFLRMALNALDGMLAREYHQETPLGCILNELGDVFSDAALYLPFCYIPGVAAPWIVVIVILASFTEMVGVLGLAIAEKRCYDGPMGKSDRALVFGCIALAFGLGMQPSPWLNGIWIAVIGLQLGTIWQRIRTILQSLPQEVNPCS